MNQRTNRGNAPSTNQGGPASGDLNIPTMGSLTASANAALAAAGAAQAAGQQHESSNTASGPGGPIVQDGEDAQALSQHVNSGGPGMQDERTFDNADKSQPSPGTPLHNETSLAALQVGMDRAQKSAHNNPVTSRYLDRDAVGESHAPRQSLAIPGLSTALETMEREDLHIQAEDPYAFKDKAAELAFMEEFLVICIHPSGSPDAENPVPLGINGRMVYIRRGYDTLVRRKYVEQLLRAKPQSVQTEQRREPNGDVRNLVHKTSAMKYPFNIVRDDNPRGRAWVRRVQAQV